MKKHLLYLLPLACVLLLAGCKKEEQNWYHNTKLVFFVEDDRGNNLLDVDYIDNILRDGISIVYKGKTYRLRNDTRAKGYVPPQFNGLNLWASWSIQDPVRMTFGEFGIVSDSSLGVKEYRGEKLTINWSDGENPLTSEIEFDLYATVKGGEPTIHQAIRVTGGVGAGAKSDNSLILEMVK